MENNEQPGSTYSAKSRHFKLIYNSDCKFCQRGVCYIKEQVQESVASKNVSIDYIPINQASALGIPIEAKALRHKIHLLDENNNLYTGAHAVLKVLSEQPKYRKWYKLYEKNRFFAILAECVYTVIARIRRFL